MQSDAQYSSISFTSVSLELDLRCIRTGLASTGREGVRLISKGLDSNIEPGDWFTPCEYLQTQLTIVLQLNNEMIFTLTANYEIRKCHVGFSGFSMLCH